MMLRQSADCATASRDGEASACPPANGSEEMRCYSRMASALAASRATRSDTTRCEYLVTASVDPGDGETAQSSEAACLMRGRRV
jgi:hypothetical protein